jgi:hypothetical protein
MSNLADIYAELLRNAHRTGQDRHADLPRGARLAVRVEAISVEGHDISCPDQVITGYQITLTIARKNARVGDRELETFKRECRVPPDALRWPAEGQKETEREGARYWIVAFRWVARPRPTGADHA